MTVEERGAAIRMIPAEVLAPMPHWKIDELIEGVAQARAIILNAYKTQPHLRLAVDNKGCAIGSWSVEKNRYVMVAGRAITQGKPWVAMEYELLINGNPPVAAEDWLPVPNPAAQEAA